MLDQLIALTNRDDFWGNWHLMLDHAYFQNDTINFIVSTIRDEYPPAEDTRRWWSIECKGVVSEYGIGRLSLPNYRINLLSEHPLLWQFEEKKSLIVRGEAHSLSRLLGDLFLVHIKACGNWLDFNGMVAGLHWRLQKEGQAEMLLPNRLLEVYQPLLEQHGLNVFVKHGLQATPGLTMLLIGNPLISEDVYRFGQVYIVAKAFSAKEIAPNMGLPKPGFLTHH